MLRVFLETPPPRPITDAAPVFSVAGRGGGAGGGAEKPPWRLFRQTARAVGLTVLLGAAALVWLGEARGEYADVVLNRNSEAAGMRPVIFPHWFHRIRFRCKVCHHELAFEMRAGANNVTMGDIYKGKFCGMCHDNKVAWGLENCNLCHSGRPGLPSGIQGGHKTLGPGRW